LDKAQIIIAEDEHIIALDIQNILKKLGYFVSAIVSSGEESIKLASSLLPDLILMDIKLRGKLDGISAAEQIYRRFSIPIIFISAYGEDSMHANIDDNNAYEYIKKPFLDWELRDTVAEMLQRNNGHKTSNRSGLF